MSVKYGVTNSIDPRKRDMDYDLTKEENVFCNQEARKVADKFISSITANGYDFSYVLLIVEKIREEVQRMRSEIRRRKERNNT